MFKHLLAVLALTAFLVPSAQARDLRHEAVPVAYLSLPFSGASRSQPVPSFGLQLNRVDYRQGEPANLFGDDRPALMDLRFRGGEWEALSFSGVNTLETRIAYGADGEPKKERRVNWKLVIPAALLGGWLVYEVARDDDAPPGGIGDAGGTGPD